jgi:hypothetical protein
LVFVFFLPDRKRNIEKDGKNPQLQGYSFTLLCPQLILDTEITAMENEPMPQGTKSTISRSYSSEKDALKGIFKSIFSALRQ